MVDEEGGGVGQGHEKETNSQNQQNVVEIIKKLPQNFWYQEEFFPQLCVGGGSGSRDGGN